MYNIQCLAFIKITVNVFIIINVIKTYFEIKSNKVKFYVLTIT